MDSYIIQVNPQDELTVVVDKLVHTHAERVYILVPDNSRIAQHALNFRLLKREADALQKEVVVVSSSPRVQNLALKAQLQAHQETKEMRHNAPQKLVDIAPPDPSLGPADTGPKRTKVKSTQPPGRRQEEKITDFLSRKPKMPSIPAGRAIGKVPSFSMPALTLSSAAVFKALLISLTSISLVIVLITLYFILPRAKITIQPRVEEISFKIAARGDIGASSPALGEGSAKFVVPAQVFEKSIAISKTSAASGEKDVEERAGGTIKVYNSYSSTPQTLVKTTRFVSEEGKLFRTIETIVVPGAEIVDGKIVPSFTTVDVVAADPGKDYNIGPSAFSIPGFKGTPKYLAFYGESEGNMSGGATGRVKVVTESDYNKLNEEVQREMEAKINEAYKIMIPEGFLIPEGARRTAESEIAASAAAGDIADEFEITAEVKTKAFAVRKADVEEMLASEFSLRFPQKVALEVGKKIIYNSSRLNFAEGSFDFEVILVQGAADFIDKTDLVEGALGRDEGGMRSYLGEYPGIDEAVVTFWPFWVGEMPQDKENIEVLIEY